MRTFKGLFCLICFLLSTAVVSGQFYNRGQDPASLKWQQILTPHFRVIFPEDFAEQGTYVADLLEYAYEPVSASLGHRPRRIPVVLHNHTVVANGFVGWAPSRVEMFTTPPQDNDAQDWLETLAVHEFRHVVQVDKFHQGMTRILSYLLGQQAAGVVFGLYLPWWFIEGDAVVIETGLTQSGRGRLPSFEQGLRAQVLQKGIYSYDKAILGSLKNHIPDQYEIGYQLVAAARSLYGAGVWDGVISHVARNPYNPVTFNAGLKKHAGLSKEAHYRQTMHMLDTVWTTQKNSHTYTEKTAAGHPEKIYTNYRYPVWINDTCLIALKNALDDIPRVVIIDMDGRERVLFTPGVLNAHALSANKRMVVWSERRDDPRWAHRSWSEIHSYDLQTGEKKKLTSGTRYFSPAVSPDGSMIAVAEVSLANEYAVVVLDARTGRVVRRYTTPGNDFLMTPAWHENNLTLAAVALDERGKRIVVTDKELGGFTTIFDAGHTEISRPRFFSADGILFNGAFSGIDQVYALDVVTATVRQLVSSPFGAVDAALSPNGKHLAWSDYSADGYGIALAEAQMDGGVLLEDVVDHSNQLHKQMAGQEGFVVSRSSVPRNEHTPEPYYKIANLFRFHSWAPLSVDAQNMTGRPGVSLMSQNTLSTAFTVVGYEYDWNEGQGKWYVDYRFEGWYPVFDMRAETGLREGFYRDQHGNRNSFLWRENIFRIGASLPLSYMRGAFFMGLQPSVYNSITRVIPTDDSPAFFNRSHFNSMQYRMLAYRQHRMVARDIRPRSGQVLDLNYRHTLFSGGDMGSVFSARGVLFLPGLLAHNSLRLGASFQKRRSGTPLPQTINYSFGNMVVYPRGITGRNDEQALILSADYALPLCYPDWNLASLLYIKRFSTNLFYDHAWVQRRDQVAENETRLLDENLHSKGIDLMAQLHFLRFFAPFDLGVRMMWPGEQSQPQYQLLWSVSF